MEPGNPEVPHYLLALTPITFALKGLSLKCYCYIFVVIIILTASLLKGKCPL